MVVEKWRLNMANLEKVAVKLLLGIANTKILDDLKWAKAHHRLKEIWGQILHQDLGQELKGSSDDK